MKNGELKMKNGQAGLAASVYGGGEPEAGSRTRHPAPDAAPESRHPAPARLTA